MAAAVSELAAAAEAEAEAVEVEVAELAFRCA